MRQGALLTVSFEPQLIKSRNWSIDRYLWIWDIFHNDIWKSSKTYEQGLGHSKNAKNLFSF